MPELFGTLPQWISSAGIIAFIGLYVKYELGRRKLGNDDVFDIRQHYATEVAALRGRLVEVEAHYRRMLKDVEEQHEECKRDREQLHLVVNGLKSELNGLKRQMSRYSTDKLVILEDTAPQASKAARRLKEV
jgi:branched-subunit amino acid aminotransferase/4-amino-4-deoxychorismate lyase